MSKYLDKDGVTHLWERLHKEVDVVSKRVDLIEQGGGKYVDEYCGRYWNFNNSTPKAAGYVGNLQMLRDLPDLLNLGGYLVKNDHSRRKLSSVNHHYYQDGTPAKLDGSEGHYQAGWNRKWYVLWEWDDTQKILTEKLRISPAVGYYEVPIASDSASGWAALDRTTNTLVSYCNTSTRYRGGNNNSSYDGKYNSLLGMPASSQTTANFMAYAKKNGDGWLCSTGRIVAAWYFLFTAIMGTLRTVDNVNTTLDANGLRQGGLGGGCYWNWGQLGNFNSNNPFIPMSAGADKGDLVGSFSYTITTDANGTKKTFNVPDFFGYKNFYIYLWRETCDEFLEYNSDGSQTHYQVIAPYYSTFTFGTKDSTVLKGSTTPACTSSNWYFISREALNGFELIPTEVKGSRSTLFGDGYYNHASSSGLRLAARSAAAGSGGNGGSCVLHGDVGLGDASASWGSSLSEAASEFRVTALTEVDIANMVG